MNRQDKHSIGPDNSIERKIDGCEIRLFFRSTRNEIAERLVLDSLMTVFDRRVKEMEGRAFDGHITYASF